MSVGRDLMLFGGMEDLDLDDTIGETDAWSFGEASMICPSEARRGTGAICSFRSPANYGPATMRFGSRIRLRGDRVNDPETDVTFLVWEKGVDRGPLSVEATFRASQGPELFGTAEIARFEPHANGWQARWVDIDVPEPDAEALAAFDPANPLGLELLTTTPRAMTFRIAHEPPHGAEGYAVIDDAALVSWEAPTLLDGVYRTPSPFDFVRIGDARPGDTVSITFHSWELD